jgi:amidophosphoribosyltransferase
MSELFHECGLAAIYHLPSGAASPLCPPQGPDHVSRLIPRMLLDVQNRGQLSAGITSYQPRRDQLLDTYRGVGTVSEVFRLSHRGKAESINCRSTTGLVSASTASWPPMPSCAINCWPMMTTI